MNKLLSLVILSITFTGTLSFACEKDMSKNIVDGCNTVSINFSIVQRGLDALKLNNLNSIEADAANLIKGFGDTDSCKLYETDRAKYNKFMDLKAISSGIQKIRNGATTTYNKNEDKSLTPRELAVIAGLLDSKLNVQATIDCRRF